MAVSTPFSELLISTDSSEAMTDCKAAQRGIVYRRSDAMASLTRARDSDPECAFTQALYGLMLSSARKASLAPQVSEALQLAKSHMSSASKREQHYVAALEAATIGNPLTAASIYESILAEHPTDLIALTFLQGELFWAGEMPRSAKSSQALLKHWHPHMPDHAAFLANRAFDLEETNEFDAAETAGREAIELDKHNIWAAHAVAHVLYMQNRADDGVSWLQQLNGHWENANQMQFHLWWHHCLFLIEQGKHADVLALYDSHVRNAEHPLIQTTPDLFLDIQNSASLLWRLETAGVNVANRWQELANVVTPRIEDINSPFTSAHFALVMAAIDDKAACKQLLHAMQSYVADHQQSELAVSVQAAVPAAQAAILHREGKHAEVISTLLPHISTLEKMGGSHAQQDVFYQLLFDSAKQTSNSDLADKLHHHIEAIGFHEPAQRAMYQM